MKYINWKDHLVNLFVVILGISIAFAMENWRDNNQLSRMEKEYLIALKEDLMYDLEYLDTMEIIDQSKSQMLRSLTQMTLSREKNDSAGYYIAYLQYNVPFSPQSVTFDALKASGKLEVITNFDLRKDIVALYSQYYGGIYKFDDELNFHIREFLRPYITENVTYSGPYSVSNEFLDDNSFRNIVFSYQTLFSQRMKFYAQVKTEVSRIIELIEMEIDS